MDLMMYGHSAPNQRKHEDVQAKCLDSQGRKAVRVR